MSPMAVELGTIGSIWKRDMLRLKRERSRWLGVILQPLMFWFIIGSGMADSFQLHGDGDSDYLRYFFPGILVMILLFTAIFSTISVIEDRQSGFLQGVLVGPGSRASLVVGKLLGVVTLALMQCGLLLVIAPWAGYGYGDISWLPLLLGIIFATMGLTAVGMSMAWLLRSSAAYHALMSLVLLPLWVISGAMFPTGGAGWVNAVMAVNPMSYAVYAVRGAMNGGVLPTGDPSMWLSVAVLVGFAAAMMAAAVTVCSKSSGKT